MYCPGSGGQVRVPRSVSQDRRGKESSRRMGRIFFIGLPVGVEFCIFFWEIFVYFVLKISRFIIL
jgi:hypothetical protein